MLITPVPAVIPVPTGPPRTPGIHLSRVVKSIAFHYKLLTADWLEDVDLVEIPADSTAWWNELPVVARLRMCMGLAWEQWYLPQLDGVDYQPGELCLEGVYMTPDGESLNTVYREEFEHAVHECKLTYKSTNTVRELAGEWLWLAQVRGYCKALGCKVGYIHVFFVCGDYSRPIQPQLKVWRVEFEDEELDESWELIQLHIRQKRGSL